LNEFRIVIVGAGFAGAVTAISLLRGWDAPRPLRIALVERSGDVGRGVAYATPDPQHLLNVPLAKMSALPDRPSDHLDWARRHGIDAGPATYLPRRVYGDYVRDTFEAALRGAPSGTLTRHAGEAIRIDGADPAVVVTRGGERLPADAVVLAVGLSRPEPIGADLGHPGYVGQPWDHGRISALTGAREVLVIGTGHTMVDVALTLCAGERGPRVTALSRAGLLPHTQRPGLHAPAPPAVRPGECTTADGLAARVTAAARAAPDWRPVIDGLRPVTQALWRALSEAEKVRFVERYSRQWEIHRSRMAPDVGARIAELRRSGRLRVVAGSIGDVDPRAYDAIVNGAGPAWDLRRGEELVRGLLESGRVAPGPAGLGLRTDADGRCAPGLYTLGALRRGELWETIAIPEIREQAAALATTLQGIAISPEVVAGG
jgi:uncharacterized NAD(P)/FAD-binding protein YdhS